MPAWTTIARFVKIVEKRAFSAAIRMSQARMSARPAATATPLTAAMVGLRQSPTFWIA